MNHNLTFSPSLMSADLLDLKNQINILRQNGFTKFHLDVMDLHFAPNITLGFNLINKLNELPIIKDIHLMVENVPLAVSYLQTKPGDYITFHLEIKADIQKNIDLIKKKAKAGIALNPETEIERIFPYLNKIDLILLLAVKPGFGGQKFINIYDKAEKLVNYLKAQGKNTEVMVDGGIDTEHIKILSDKGIKSFVLGRSSLFKGHLKRDIEDFKKSLQLLGLSLNLP